jgi:hypothetical protein
MKMSVDVWLRGDDFATTASVEGPMREPRAWIDDDVRMVLEGMLRAMDRQKRPDGDDRAIALRGLSWIVNPFEEGAIRGVVIAIEITLGAAIAGPFDVDKSALESMIARVLAAPAVPAVPSDRVH